MIKFYIASDGPKEWAHREKAKTLYEIGDVLRFYFFSPQEPDQPGLPQLLLSIEALRRDVLGAYRLTPNGNGLSYEIIVNSFWADGPLYELAETMLHEQTHLYQQRF